MLSLWMGAAQADAPEPVVDQASAEAAAREWTAITAAVVLQVDDRAACLDDAIALARARGGWFAELGTERVALRVPVAQAQPLVEELREMGRLVERNFSSVNLAPEVVDVQSRRKARREILARYEAVLAEASPKAIVSVERQITGVVAELEQLEGRMRVLTDRAETARIEVSLQFRERRAPTNDGSSSFAWLNSLNVSELLHDFEMGVRGAPSGASVPVPEGFAAWNQKRRFQAVSPDDVVFRVRRARNKPQAELSYWREALRNRMTGAGYTVIAESDISATGTPGVLLELGAANGEQDQAYVLAVFVDGRHLVIAEATGESMRFQTRRAAIVSAMEGMDIL
jgi:hypothetical protein